MGLVEFMAQSPNGSLFFLVGIQLFAPIAVDLGVLFVDTGRTDVSIFLVGFVVFRFDLCHCVFPFT